MISRSFNSLSNHISKCQNPVHSLVLCKQVLNGYISIDRCSSCLRVELGVVELDCLCASLKCTFSVRSLDVEALTFIKVVLCVSQYRLEERVYVDLVDYILQQNCYTSKIDLHMSGILPAAHALHAEERSEQVLASIVEYVNLLSIHTTITPCV